MVSADLVAPGIQKIIERETWTEPRPVQRRVWQWFADPINSGRDLIVCAPTAVGKTEAVFFPLIDRLATSNKTQGYEILYICPLKALIDQQSRRLAPWAETRACGAFGLHGGTKRGTSKSAQKTGGILVTTPESLEGLLHRNQTQTLLGPLRWVVIDELHAFFDSTRGVQIISQLARLEAELGTRLIRLGLSATLSEETIGAAKSFLRPAEPDRVDLIVDKTPALRPTEYEIRTFIEKEQGITQTALQQIARTVDQDVVRPMLSSDRAIVHRKALMFCNSRRLVEAFTQSIRASSEESTLGVVYPHHGSLDKEVRRSAEAALRDSEKPHLVVSTSTLELGIDIGAIDLVVQVDPGPTVASLRQRLGRSGRRHGAISRLLMMLRATNTEINKHPLACLHFDLFQALAQISLVEADAYEAPQTGALHLSTFVQQCLSMARAGVDFDEIRRTLLQDGPFCREAEALYKRVFDYLATEVINRPLLPLLYVPNEQQDDAEKSYLVPPDGVDFVQKPQFGTSFKTTTTYAVRLGGVTLGNLPVGHNLKPGDPLVFAGQLLRVKSVIERPATLLVEPGDQGRPPPFAGSAVAPSDLVVRTMRGLYAGGIALPQVKLCKCTLKLIDQGRSKFRQLGLQETPVVELEHDAGVALFPWVGQKTQSTLALLLRSQGLPALETHTALSIPGTSPEALRAALERIAAGNHPEPNDLIRALPSHQFDRYDYLLSAYARRQNYISARIDIAGAREAAISALS